MERQCRWQYAHESPITYTETIQTVLIDRETTSMIHLRNRWCVPLMIVIILVLILTVVLIYFFTIPFANNLPPVVQTASGPVRGEFRTATNFLKYFAFRGIPFAKPPIGYLRFKPPVIPDSWTDIFNATSDGAACVQYDPALRTVLGDEDCLYLSVFTTAYLTKSPTKLKAVIVYIYGGAFISGSAALKNAPPDYLMTYDVVCVYLNYRGGAFGFISLNHPNATGNVGLKDLVLGLKWVQMNIEKFGGNPNNVTILGASAGSAAVSYLVLSDAAAGLFHGSISMSGVPLNPWAFHRPLHALQQAHKLADKLGLNWTNSESFLVDLYKFEAYDIAMATSYISRHFPAFAPTIENKSIATDPFLTECPYTKYFTGNFSKVPQIIGFEDNETVSFVLAPEIVREIIDVSISASTNYHIEVPESIISAKKRLERNKSFWDDISYSELQKFIQESSIILYISQINWTQNLLASDNNNKPIYYYHISYFAPGPHYIAWNNTLPGAGHGDDISFLFYYDWMNYNRDFMKSAHRTINRICTMWTNFAKYGNPTPDWVNEYSLNFTWPESGRTGNALEIGNELIVGSRPITRDMEMPNASSMLYFNKTMI